MKHSDSKLRPDGHIYKLTGYGLVAFSLLNLAGCSTLSNLGVGQRTLDSEYQEAAAENRSKQEEVTKVTVYKPEPVTITKPVEKAPATPPPSLAAKVKPEPTPLKFERPVVEKPIAPRRASKAPSDPNRPDLPVHAKPGECYARVNVPARYRSEQEKVVVREAYKKSVTEPAEYKWVNERVIVKPASEVVVEVIPAQYKTVSERVMVEPERWKVKEIPAVYNTVIEKVLVQPARTEWKVGRGPEERTDHDTGEIMCLVEIPAVYDSVERKELKTPARSERVRVSAKYRQVTKKVMVSPERVRKEKIPAKYKNVRIRKKVRDERVRTENVPAQIEYREKKVLVAESSVRWQQVLCENNATRSRVREIQDALYERGYNPGKMDGKLGPMTYEAVEKYQKDNKLPRGAITYEVLDSLGVNI